MSPLTSVRAPAPAAPTPAAAPADTAAPGFAGLLEAAREPAAPAAPPTTTDADGAVQAAAPESPTARAKTLRKAHATAHKKPIEDTPAEPSIAPGVLAALRAAQPGVASAGEPAVAATAADECALPPPEASAMLPSAVPFPPQAARIEAGAESAPTDATAGPHAGNAREAMRAAPLPTAAPEPSTAPTSKAAITGAEKPLAEPAPISASTVDAPRRAPLPNPADAAPAAMSVATPPAWGHMPASATAATAAPFSAHLAAALESPAFAPALATQVRWLVEGGVQQAQLTLNPAEMGPVAVRIAVDGTQARIDFMADLAPTRAALEASLPTLAAALADGGLTLAGGGVFDGSSARQSQPEAKQGAARSTHAAATTDSADSAPRAPNGLSRARGLVDLVA